MNDAKVRDWMHRGVIACSPDTPADEVAGAMAAHDVSALVVVDADGYIRGRFIDPDYRKRMAIDDLLQAIRSARLLRPIPPW